MYNIQNYKDNLFNANHRFHMKRVHGMTMAQVITVDDLLADYTLEKEWKPIDTGCHASEVDSCDQCRFLASL
jgi:hypothetical protein